MRIDTSTAQFLYEPASRDAVDASDRNKDRAAPPPDTISISDTARTAVEASAGQGTPSQGTPSQGTPSQGTPSQGTHGVEIYQIPEWFAKYGSDLTVSLGEKASAIAARNSRFDRLTPDEQREYGQLVYGHYRDLLNENGVHSAEAHYELFIRDPQSSEALRLDMENRVAGDDRLVELLHRLSGRSTS